MSNILSLHNVHESDYDKAGFKAVDLARLHNKKLTIPLTFIITIQAFRDFMEENGLNVKIKKILSILDINSDKEMVDAYDNIKELFSKAEFPEEMREELLEAYSTLSIDINLDASKMVNAEEKPFVSLTVSPSYVIDPEDNSGIVQNIRGKHNFFNGIKRSWMSLYSPKALIYRHLNDLGHDVAAAIIVQKMINATASAETYSRDLKAENDDIKTNTFFGFEDYEHPIKGDHHEVSKEDLTINNSKINFQEYKIARDPETGDLEQVFLKESGYQQKVHDKIIMELARLTKRISSFLNKEVKTFFAIKNEGIYLLHCNKIIDIEKPKPQPKIIEEIAKPEEPTPLEISAEFEEEPNFDPDKEDLGVEKKDAELEEDLAFLDSIEKQEKEIDSYAELEKELEVDKEKVEEKVEEELEKEEEKEPEETDGPEEEETFEEMSEGTEDPERPSNPAPSADEEETDEEDSIFSDIKKEPDDY